MYILLMCVAFINRLSAQASSNYKNVLPLNIGNNWRYDYNYEFSYRLNLAGTNTTEKGTVNYSVLDSINLVDSTKWKIKISWNIIVVSYFYSIDFFEGSWDTTYSVIDSTISDLIELNKSNHHIYFMNDSSAFKVWRFPYKFWDSVEVNRFQIVNDSNYSTTVGKEWSNGTVPVEMTFQKDTGLVKLYIDYSAVMPLASAYLFCQLQESEITLVDRISNDNIHPTKYLIFQNYPNPFNPSTNINYSIPKTSLVTIKIYDILGIEVASLVNEEKAPGRYSVNFNGNKLSSGVYFYRMQAGSFVETKKLLLLK